MDELSGIEDFTQPMNKSQQIKSKLVLFTCDQINRFSPTHAKTKRDNGKTKKADEQYRVLEGSLVETLAY